MANMIKDLVTGVIKSALQEILKKTGISKSSTKRQKRQAQPPVTGRSNKTPPAKPKRAKKQVSRRKSGASRSKSR